VNRLTLLVQFVVEVPEDVPSGLVALELGPVRDIRLLKAGRGPQPIPSAPIVNYETMDAMED
jgi:hypothetical protein